MPNNRNAVRAGIFMLLSIVAAIAIIIAIAGGADFALRYQTHLVSFKLTDNISGLRKGDDVRLGGLKVGTISAIRFEKQNALGPNSPPVDSILIWISTPAEYTLASDALVGIETSLTGVSDINITDLGSGPALASDVALAGRPDSLTAFRSALAVIGPKISPLLDKAHATLDTYNAAGQKITIDVHELAADLHTRLAQMTSSATKMLDSIQGWFGPSTGDFHQTVANLRDVTGGLKEKLPPITASAQELLNRLNASIAKVQGSLDDVKTALANTKDMTGTLRSVIDRNEGRFDEIIARVHKTMSDADQLLTSIRQSPWRVIYRPTGDLAANLNLYDAAREFADGANSLNDAAVVLRDALKDPKADPAKVQKLYDALQNQFSKFSQTEDDLWKKVRQ